MSDADAGSLDQPSTRPPAGSPDSWRRPAASSATTSFVGHGGRAALARYSERLDATAPSAPGRRAPHRAVRSRWSRSAATAGGSCALHSDIDLLVLFGGRLGPRRRASSSASSCTRSGMLGLVVGHQVREIDEFARLEVDNPEFLMALVDARPVAGDLGLFAPLRVGVPSRRHARARRRRAEHAHRRPLRAVQFDALSARARRQGSAGRPARPDGHALDCGADRSVAAPARARGSRAGSTKPRISCCASARFSTSRASAITTRSATRCRRKRRTSWATRARFRSSASSG